MPKRSVARLRVAPVSYPSPYINLIRMFLCKLVYNLSRFIPRWFCLSYASYYTIALSTSLSWLPKHVQVAPNVNVIVFVCLFVFSISSSSAAAPRLRSRPADGRSPYSGFLFTTYCRFSVHPPMKRRSTSRMLFNIRKRCLTKVKWIEMFLYYVIFSDIKLALRCFLDMGPVAGNAKNHRNNFL